VSYLILLLPYNNFTAPAIVLVCLFVSKIAKKNDEASVKKIKNGCETTQFHVEPNWTKIEIVT